MKQNSHEYETKWNDRFPFGTDIHIYTENANINKDVFF